jgi:hypothetical protein
VLTGTGTLGCAEGTEEGTGAGTVDTGFTVGTTVPAGTGLGVAVPLEGLGVRRGKGVAQRTVTQVLIGFGVGVPEEGRGVPMPPGGFGLGPVGCEMRAPTARMPASIKPITASVALPLLLILVFSLYSY